MEKVAMSKRSEIVRVDSQIESLLALPPADAVRRIMQAFELSGNQVLFVAALVGRLVTASAMANHEKNDFPEPRENRRVTGRMS